MTQDLIDSSIIIKAENVSKCFQLGQFVSLASTLRHIKRIVCHPFELFSNTLVNKKKERFEDLDGKRYLWALRDISFELRRGERVAILGRNGAGKSTLLKILVGIMTPTEGSIYSSIRIVPLMGVGAGFNPELSGRENVFLYGGILGVSPKEIKERYNQIVTFAEIDEFMETPLKRYSKGMRARLGMAVALNLAPDVLVVDEVLAVGDIKFRSKCVDLMKEMCVDGMTLLFVSHSPARVKSLCDRAILLRDGMLIDDGDAHDVLERYLREDGLGTPNPDADLDDDVSTTKKRHDYLGKVVWELENAPGDDVVQITMVRVTDEHGNEKQNMDIRKPVILEMEYVVHDERVLRPQFQIFNKELEIIFGTIDSSTHWRTESRTPNTYRSRAIIPGNLLTENTYIVGASVYQHTPLIKHARTGEVVSFKVINFPDPESAQSDYPRFLVGVFRPLLEWETNMINADCDDRAVAVGGDHQSDIKL